MFHWRPISQRNTAHDKARARQKALITKSVALLVLAGTFALGAGLHGPFVDVADAAHQGMLVKSGSYTGNGTDNHAITGVGFQPDLVIIKGDNSAAAIAKTSTWADNKSKLLVTSVGSVVTDGIKTLDADGFTLGTNASANTDGTTYYYIAVKDNGGNVFETGSYTGDGNDDRDITGVGFEPDFVVVMRDGDNPAAMRTSGHTGDSSQLFNGAAITNVIQGFHPDGFQIGTNAAVIASAGVYHYLAVKNEAGIFQRVSYTGNGIDDRSITEVGFRPDFALVKQEDDTPAAALRFKDNVGDSSMTPS